jgi:hypothetical protein
MLMRAASSRAAAVATLAAGRATAAYHRLRNGCNQAIEICVATSYAEKRCAALGRIPHRRARPPVRVQSAGKSRRKEGSHDRAPTVKVVAKAPEFDHGDIENNNPMPLPAVNGNNLIAKTANAALATAETDDSVGASIGEDFQARS